MRARRGEWKPQWNADSWAPLLWLTRSHESNRAVEPDSVAVREVRDANRLFAACRPQRNLRGLHHRLLAKAYEAAMVSLNAWLFWAFPFLVINPETEGTNPYTICEIFRSFGKTVRLIEVLRFRVLGRYRSKLHDEYAQGKVRQLG